MCVKQCSTEIVIVRLAVAALLLFVTVTATASFAVATELNIALGTPSGKIEISEVGGTKTAKVDDQGYYQLWDEGNPILPYRVVSVLLPQGEVVDTYKIVSSGRTVVADDFVPTVSPPAMTDDGIKGAAVPIVGWSEDSSRFPSTPIVYLGTGYLHGYAIASFAVFPLRIQDNSLIQLDDVSLNLTTRVETSQETVSARERFRRGFREKVRRELGSLVINPDAAVEYQFNEIAVAKPQGGFQPTSFPSLEGSPVDYVIITNDSLAAAYQTLADWKTSKGVPTVIRTTEWIEANYRNGSDLQETIRNFVKEAYAKWGITYVLLGGDTEQIPARIVRSNYYNGGRFLAVDMYYVCLDGDWNADGDDVFGEKPPVGNDNPDLYAELYVGRLPTQNAADVALLTAKIIDYEMPDSPDYTNRVIFLAEVLFWSGNQISLNGADLAEFAYQTSMQDPGLDVVRMYETDDLFPGSVPENREAALDSLEVGFDHVVHIGHGFRFNMHVYDGNIMNVDADTLSNGTRYSNLYLLNCTALAYTYFCLAEHFLLAPNGGGVSAIGANESAFPNASSYYMYEYYRLVFMEGVVHAGEAFARSRLPRTPFAQISDNVDLWTHYIYSFLGDPEMPLWTNQVDALTVTHVPSVGMGTTSIQVTVEVDASPVDSAMVCLTKGTDDYQYGWTNGSGQVTFDFRAESAGEIQVVVTGRNHIRYDGTITVTGESGAYVSLSGMTVDDDNTGGTSGNGDGVIDAGETVDLMLEMINSGASASGNVTLKLRSNDGGVTIDDSTAAVGVVGGGGGTVAAADPVRVTFSSSISDETAVGFSLVVEEGGTPTWGDTFKKIVHAPALELVKLRIDDTAFGNGDGVNQAGEVFDLYCQLKNYGTGTAYGLSAEVVDLDGLFTFVDSTSVIADMGPLDEVENTTGLRMSEADVLTEHRMQFTVTDAYGRSVVDTLELRPPLPPTNLSFDPSLGTDRLAARWDASTSTDVAKYNVYRSDLPGGPYVRANADPVDHTLFVDTGLLPSTLYFYVVTAVDRSGNESAPSSEGGGSTNPPQIGGFPIKMNVSTTSSPVVGDIDGDGDLEMVIGDDYVYAWHHDGLELIDGDGDPQSWGVLTTDGFSYISPIALARLDGNPGLEIVAASRDSMKVYVFDSAGATLPGWPQPVEHFIRAGVVVGDINDDNNFEIIAIDESGVLYVWEPNGAEYRDGDSSPSTPGVFRRFTGCVYQYGSPAVADIDMDGLNEIIVATQGDSVFALNEDGTSVTGWPIYLGSDGVGGVVVGDLDNDGGGDLEVVVNTYNGDLRAYHHDGSVLWSKWYTNGLLFGPSPALGDLDGGGDVETIIPSANGNLYAIKSNGMSVSGWPVVYSTDTYTESSPIVADLNADGLVDVLLGDETKLIKAWDRNGDLLAGFPLATGDAMRGVPAVADVDDDGDLEVLAGGWDGYMYVWDVQNPYNADNVEWGNFQGNRHNNGRHGSKIPTAVGAVAFAFDIGGGGAVNLTWSVPAPASYGRFDVARAVASEEGTPGEFAVLVTGRVADVEGMVRYADAGARVGERYVYQLRGAEEAGSEVVHTTGTIYVPVRAGSLSQNYPNPFNPTTRITYYVPEGSARRVRLVVYDVRGARVRTLVDGELRGGKYTVEWDGRNDGGEAVGSGVYFYRLTERSFTKTKKMLLLK
jgi:hypothetical protein